MKTKKNILVVGGAGYVGGAVTDILLKKKEKYNVRVYDLLMYEETYRKPVDFVFGDVLDTDKLKVHLKWADKVIWLAGIVGDGACSCDPTLTRRVNQEAVQWLVNNFNGRIVFPSTCSVYGAQNNILTEASDVKPLSLYAETKIECEKILKNSDAVIFRLGTLYGVSDAYSRVRLDLVANVLTAKASNGEVLSVFGGDQWRPLLHVRDAAEAMVDALEFAKTKEAEIYNIGQVNMRILDLAKRIRKIYPKAKLQVTEMSFEDKRNYQVKWDKAVKHFGFAPKRNIEDGIKEMGDLVESRRVKDYSNSRYSNHAYLKIITKK